MIDTSGNDLEVLAKHRDDLLLAEVAAWLHDMGKCDERHLWTQAKDYDKSNPTHPYDYKTAHADLVDGAGSKEITLLGETVPLKTLITEGRPANKDTHEFWLVRTLGYCHSAAHTEKEEVYILDQQTIADTRCSSPFGYEAKPLIGLKEQMESLPFEQLSDRAKFRLGVGNRPGVEKVFDHVCADTQRPINEVTLWDYSHVAAAFYKAALATALLGFENDPPKLRWRLLSVRLNGASFLEGVARIPDLIVRQKLISDGLDKVRTLLEEKYPLGTEIYRDGNGSVFIVPDIGSLLQLKDEDKKTLSDLILHQFDTGTIKAASSLQLGGEVVPSLKLGESWQWNWNISHLHQPPLPIADHVTFPLASQANSHIVKSWWQDHHEDICTVCQLRPQGWEADYKAHYDRRGKGVRCPPIPPCQTCKALERKVCAICKQRREDRSKRWAGELETTIWIDEIADTNGGLALVVGKFGLKPWLDGEMLFYPTDRANRKSLSRTILKVRTLDIPPAEGEILPIRRNNYTWSKSLGALISLKEVEKNQVPNPFRNDQLQIQSTHNSTREQVKVADVQKLSSGHYRITLDKILSSFAVGASCLIRGQNFQVSGNGSQVETISDEAIKIVEDQILHPGRLVVEQSSELYSMVETQTPARLHRVWETTQKFWEEITSDFKTIFYGSEPSPCLRLRIRGTFVSNADSRNTLGVFHAYELKLGNINLSVTCVADGEFLTVDNLQRVAVLLNPSKAKEYRKDYEKAVEYVDEQLEELLKLNEPTQVEESTGYGGPNKILGKLRLTNVSRKNPPYIPAIPILTEPQTFMVLVPADRVLKVAQDIKKRYQKQMGKVRNRLPLTLGIVFTSRRTPLPAILDAGQRMLKQPTESEEWAVKNTTIAVESIHSDPKPSTVKVTLEKEDQLLAIGMSALMGDGITADVWYPYWRIVKDVHGSLPVGRNLLFGDKDDKAKIWAHICDLQEGDMVHLLPSRLDFEFLDTAARRFEISYDNGKRRGTSRPARPYYLEQLDEFETLWTILSEGLETTQINNLMGVIETKRMEWAVHQDKTVFERMVRDALNNANWKHHPTKEFEQLCRAAVSGLLADVVELYMHILKRKTKVDQTGGDQ